MITIRIEDKNRILQEEVQENIQKAMYKISILLNANKSKNPMFWSVYNGEKLIDCGRFLC